MLIENRNGNTFSTGKLDAFSQLHIARKLAPALPLVEGLVKPENAEKNTDLLFLMALGQLSDDAANFVMQKCLRMVQVKQPTGWARLTNDMGGLQFDTVPMDDLLYLTNVVIAENLGDFFRTSLGVLVKEPGDTV